MKKAPPLTGIILILLLSGCELLFGPENKSSTKKFWAQNTVTSYFYQIDAELLAENDRCKVWAEAASGVSKAAARKVAAAYSDIYTKMLSVFGFEFPVEEDGQTKFYNALQYADVDGDGKLCILLLDIKDDYKKGENESTVAGYFWSENLFKNDPNDSILKYSNECDMIYIDTKPGVPGENEANMTLAHELQHLMNLVTSIAVRTDKTYYYPMDLWINEGLSSAAEWVYLRDHPEINYGVPSYHPLSRWGWYLYNGDNRETSSHIMNGLIDKGNNFFVWGNRENENPYAILDEYATVYLFFQWLRIHSDTKEGIYKDIISSKDWDYKAVTEAASKRIHGEYSSWSALIRDWLAANYINAPDGFLGYKNDPDLGTIKGHLLSTNKTDVELYPGEGVYSLIDEAYAASHSMPSSNPSSPNIYYYVLTETFTESEMKPGALLTYNLNPANYIYEGNVYKDPLPETGTVTGVAAGKSASASAQWRAVTLPGLTGPYRIGAEDVVRRNGAAVPLPAALPLLQRNIPVSE